MINDYILDFESYLWTNKYNNGFKYEIIFYYFSLSSENKLS